MIPVNIPLITDDDVEAVAAVLRDGWISGEAPIVEEFESTFASAHGQKYGVSVPNGSLALDLVIATMEIGPGDEVILPTFTIISCVSEILRRGATPVFVDADPTTWNMNVQDVEELVSERTKAIMAVHTYGLPVDMDPLLDISQRHGIPIIEDSAEAHGLKYRNKVCGSMGYVATYSFYANKNVTTGEGGMILTSDDAYAEKLRYYRNLTFQSENRFVHEDIGWNLRFTAIQAALGMSQLARLDDTIERRRAIAAHYRRVLGDLPGLEFAPEVTEYASNDYWVVGVLLDPHTYPGSRTVAQILSKSGIQTRPFFFPLHNQPVYEKSQFYSKQHHPVAENLYATGLYLPNGLGHTDAQISHAAETVRKVLPE